jgi:hypothetical protein
MKSNVRFIMSRLVLLRMRNVAYRRENQNSHFAVGIFFSENPSIYEVMWKNIVEPGVPQLKVWRMRIA